MAERETPPPATRSSLRAYANGAARATSGMRIEVSQRGASSRRQSAPVAAIAASAHGRPRAIAWRSLRCSGGTTRIVPGRAPGEALQLVRLAQLGVLLGQHLGERDHHLGLLPGGVVLHLAVDHVNAAAV